MNELIKRIQSGESRSIEFKREIPGNLSNLLKTIVAFANDAGGEILIGVDNDGRIVGINTDTLQLEERISNSVHDKISPIPTIYYQVINLEDKQVFSIKVMPGAQKPYLFKNKEGNTVYIRIGSTNKTADPSIINEMHRQNLNQTYDELIYYGQTVDELSGSLISMFKKSYGEIDSGAIDLLIRDRYAVKTNGKCYPLIGTVLLFSETLPEDLDYASIEVNRYEGRSRSNLLATKRISKGLLELTALAINELKNYLQTYVKIENIQREDRLEIPEHALREAVINAICHRDYSMIGSSAKIDVFDDRLEIISPGNLPVGITLSDLGQGASEIRNRVIAKAFRRMGLIEKLGTGITRMIDECSAAGMPLPVFEEPGRYFKVTFSKNYIDNTNKLEKRIIECLQKTRESKTVDLAESLEVHPNTVLNKLKVLIDRNVVEKIGSGPNVRYRLKL